MSDNRVMNHKLHIFLSIITLSVWVTFYALLFIIFKLSGSTIEKRRERRGINKELSKERREINKGKKVEQREINEAKKVEQRKANYAKEVQLLQAKKGKKFYPNGSMAYTLACGHQIRSAKQVGMFSKGLLMKTVWCDICKDHRTVTGTLDPWVR